MRVFLRIQGGSSYPAFFVFPTPPVSGRMICCDLIGLAELFEGEKELRESQLAIWHSSSSNLFFLPV